MTTLAEASMFVEHLDEALRRACRRLGHERVELYHRVTQRSRLEWPRDGATPRTVAGVDEGTALLVQDREAQDRTGVGVAYFAAATGSPLRRIDRLLESATPLHTPRGVVLGDPGRVQLQDHDPGSETLPSPELSAAWLREVGSRIPERQRGQAWIESARTCESWARGGGFRASRSRLRWWALTETRPIEASGPADPLRLLACRGTTPPALEPWEALGPPLVRPAGLVTSPVSGKIDLVFAPSAAATLVQSLVRSLATGRRTRRGAVGPGWVVTHDPGASGALLGGTFDDCGFETRRVRLADGRGWTGEVVGAGCLRRPAFRDPPAAFPCHLEVQAPAAEPSSRSLRVYGLRIHPFPGHWWLELHGWLERDGRLQAPVRTCVLRTDPRALTAACRGGLGSPLMTHLGVRTPSLVFESLEVRSVEDSELS